jgi:TonB family protein
MTLQADPVDALIPTPDDETVAPPRRRPLAPILFSLLAHLVVLAVILYEQSLLALQTPQDQEVPVEVIVEPPPQPPPPEPEPQPEPEPEPEKEQPKPKPEEKPPQQKLILDEKPAYDAPRAANRETVQREAPDQETKAQRQAPPDTARASKPSPETTADPQQQQEAKAEMAPEAPKAEEEKPDAEILEQAKPEPKPQPDQKQGKVEIKASPEPKLKSISEQLAALEPLPDFKFSGASKPAPVSGGTSDTSYLSVLYGMIVPHLHIPPHLRGKRPPNVGLIQFYVDGAGHLTHQAVARSSGFPELDAAALAAVRRGAPFPAPPAGHALGVIFHFAGR